MKREQKKHLDEESVCWQAIPIQYDNFPKGKSDRYDGDIFGNLTMFESPHFLWRRFHKNYCKAILLTELTHYELVNNEEDYQLYEVYEILEQNFSLEVLSRHNALVFIVAAVETFLRDSFLSILENVYPEKLDGKGISEFEKYSFQNAKQIRKDFKWLCPNFDIESDENVKDAFDRRHKIVHKSHYIESYTKDEFKSDANALLVWAHYFEFFFNDEGYWDKIVPKADK